jgi:hypothetical protein
MSDIVPPAPRARAWRMLRLGGLLAILAFVAFSVLEMLSPTDMQHYARDFDTSVSQIEPAVASVLRADPALRTEMLRQTKAAYDTGGWAAASQLFIHLKYTLIQNYADDRTTLACGKSYIHIARALLPIPSLCRAYLLGNGTDPRVGQVMIANRKPCDDAILDGGRRRLAGTQPPRMTDASIRAAFIRSYDGPSPLSNAERDALSDPTSDDRLMCVASIKLLDNIAALPDAQAAMVTRARFNGEGSPASYPVSMPVTPPPPSLTFAPAGTVFTLSMEGRDGKPITWTSLGQDGWDCRIRSSASGLRPLWGPPRFNPIRVLWPLEVGETKKLPGETPGGLPETLLYHVASLATYQLPFGPVKAYAIEVSYLVNGRSQYMMTHYWSPDLGFKIGQRTETKLGLAPDDTAPDWQLISVSHGE